METVLGVTEIDKNGGNIESHCILKTLFEGDEEYAKSIDTSDVGGIEYRNGEIFTNLNVCAG
jgi:hypothetical protein